MLTKQKRHGSIINVAAEQSSKQQRDDYLNKKLKKLLTNKWICSIIHFASSEGRKA